MPVLQDKEAQFQVIRLGKNEVLRQAKLQVVPHDPHPPPPGGV